MKRHDSSTRGKPAPLLLIAVAVALASGMASAGELGDLLQDALQHPQIRVASRQNEAAQAQVEAAQGRYLGSASLSAGWHQYEHPRVIGVFTPGTADAALVADRITQIGVIYALPVDVFGVIAAGRERAGKDLAAAELLGRQQTLLKLHQAASAYFTLQALQRQHEALAVAGQRVAATLVRVRKEVELGKAPGIDARLAESELARLEADRAQLDGAIAQAQADLAEATGKEDYQPAAPQSAAPAWEAAGDTLPARIAQARQDAARAQAEEARRALWPSLTLDAGAARSFGGGDSRDTWAVGGVVSLPLGVTAHRQADAQRLNAEAAREQKEAALRDGARQLAALRAAYDAALADARALEKEVEYRDQVVAVQTEMQRLDNQTLENLFRHERDLLDARYRLAQARARAAAAWSSAQVLAGMAPETYIARLESPR
jgi:outer membrane protein TolC